MQVFLLFFDTVGFNFCEEQSYGATEHIKQTSSNVIPTSTFVRLTCTGWYAWMQVFLINFFDIIYFVVYCLWSEILWKPMQGKQEEENLSVGTRSCGHLEKVCQSFSTLIKVINRSIIFIIWPLSMQCYHFHLGECWLIYIRVKLIFL